MSCQDHHDSIVDFVDGTLDPARQRALERHVEACPACRALVADLKSIQAAAFTLDKLEPPAAVWESLRARLAAEPLRERRGRVVAWPRTRTAWGIWVAAAAALLIVTLAGVYPLLQDSGDVDVIADTTSSPGEMLATVQAEFQAAEEHYDRAIQGMEQIVKTDSGELDPQVAGIVLKNLQVIEQAIGESRAALKTQPASSDARDSLFNAMRTKVALLQQTVELINEMRKGNQAEAGRLLQGLNQ